MIERDSTVLPEPDSPTTPSVWPRASENDTPSTALTNPRGVANDVRRSRTSSRTPSVRRADGLSVGIRSRFPHVELLSDGVADHVQRQHGEEDDQPGRMATRGGRRVCWRPSAMIFPQVGLGRRNAGAEERQDAFDDDDDPDGEEGVGDRAPGHVGQDLPPDDPPVLRPEDLAPPSRSPAAAYTMRVGPHDPGRRRDGEDADGDDDVLDVLTEHDDYEQKQDRGAEWRGWCRRAC